MIEKTLGGDRLGSGAGMKMRLNNFERSTHNMGNVFQSTMASGVLVPCYLDVILKGDVWEKEIDTIILTHPTVGPLFASFKFQLDVFTGDFRLWNKQLHNNLTGVGLHMERVMFPRIRLNAPNIDMSASTEANEQQISTSSLLAYLGVRGLGTRPTANGAGRVERLKDAQPLLMYWDIYKEYYANKQEEIGYVITGEAITNGKEITNAYYITPTGVRYQLGPNWEGLPINGEYLTMVRGGSISVEGTDLIPEDIFMIINDTQTELTSLPWEEVGTTDQGLLFSNIRENTVAKRISDLSQDSGTFLGAYREITGIGGVLKQEKFELSTIDNMRETILGHPKTSPLIIGYEGDERYELPYSATTGQQIIVEDEQERQVLNSYFQMAGLGVKTYQSDRYNNWLNTTWIDEINSMSSVNTESGSFTMNALLLAEKMYKLLNAVAVSGNSYNDWEEAVYGERSYGAPEMPVYVGGMSAEIEFEQVVSSSEYQEQPLGTLGGRGTQGRKKGGRINFKANEGGYVMAIASITPRITYSQGNMWFTDLETMDDLHKPQLDRLGFQELITEEMAAWDTKVNADGTITTFSAGKQPSWIQYMTRVNQAYGEFARVNSEMYMTLNRRYQATGQTARIQDLTTYIEVGKYNYAFAYTGIDSQPFWVQIRFNTTARRKMSANKMPNL